MDVVIPALVIVAAVVVVAVFGIRMGSAYLDGWLDAKYPRTAEGDWRTGVLDWAYRFGRARFEQQQAVVQQRRESKRGDR